MATRLPPPLEKSVQTACKKLLRLSRIAVYDTSQPFKAAITPGLPDLICFCPKRGLFFMECKRKGARQTDAQEEFQALSERAGIPYVLGGIDQLTTFLYGLGDAPVTLAQYPKGLPDNPNQEE